MITYNTFHSCISRSARGPDAHAQTAAERPGAACGGCTANTATSEVSSGSDIPVSTAATPQTRFVHGNSPGGRERGCGSRVPNESTRVPRPQLLPGPGPLQRTPTRSFSGSPHCCCHVKFTRQYPGNVFIQVHIVFTVLANRGLGCELAMG